MIRLHVVADGPRDKATLPSLVARLLQHEVEPSFSPWARLHGRGKGYPRKIRYATDQARSRNARGLVAVVDSDQDATRIGKLREGRVEERKKNPPFPTALGQADPHLEIWLLDDPVAVRESLGLASGTEIESVATIPHPKTVLNDLIRQCPRRDEDWMSLLATIAANLDPTRCIQRDRTGFRHFEEEVRTELGPLASRAQ